MLFRSTERHESRRIDNQLRGRSGRQGDQGKTKFFLSLEDDLMRIFASDKLSSIMGRLGMEQGEAIVSPMVTRAIEKAQKRVEEQNFSSRKHVLEYDDVMSQQRQVVYSKRSQALHGEFKVDFMQTAIEEIVHSTAVRLSPEVNNTEKWNLDEVSKEVEKQFNFLVDLSKLDPQEASAAAIAEKAGEKILQLYSEKFDKLKPEMKQKIENYVYLQVIDQAWKEHLLSMDSLKDSVSLRGYAQRDPLQEYKKEAFKLFSMMMDRVENDVCLALLHIPIPEMTDELSEEHDQEDEDDPTAALKNGNGSGNLDNDQLIYHGSRSNLEERSSSNNSANPQTIRRDGEKVGRNSPCPCGSGKKYKKCHGSASRVGL